MIEFFQLLLKRGNDLVINDSEVVDILINHDDEITITDAVTASVETKAAEIATLLTKKYGFENESGSRTSSGIITDEKNPVILEKFEKRQATRWNSDEDLEFWINASRTYTHRINPNKPNDGTVNGLTFNRSIGE